MSCCSGLVCITPYADQSFSVYSGLVIICDYHDIWRAIHLLSLYQLLYVLSRLN